MQYKYDQLQFSSLLPNYINVVPNLTTTISCSGTYSFGGGANFSGSITLATLTNFFDVYLINQNTNEKVKLISNVDITQIWQYKSSETLQNSVSVAGLIVTVTINLFNGTGGSLTITSQNYTFEIVQYQIANFSI